MARDRQWQEWRRSWALSSKAYRDLKKSYEDSKDYIYASDFNFGEKEMRRINHEVPRSTRYQLNLFYYASGYGERIGRPAFILLALWVMGACIYNQGGYLSLDSLDAWRKAFATSGANMALLKPNDLYSTSTSLTFFSVVQAILGPTVGAMLVLAITNKLKR